MRSFDFFRGIGLAAFVTVLLASIGAFAQTTATITGTVTDDTGAIVPNAKISVTSVGTGLTRNLVTDARGQYAALSLPVGQYEVRAESTGFAPVVRSGITLVVGQEAVVDIQLKVGGVQQAITVNAEPPLVNTTPSSTAGLVSEEQVNALVAYIKSISASKPDEGAKASASAAMPAAAPRVRTNGSQVQ